MTRPSEARAALIERLNGWRAADMAGGHGASALEKGQHLAGDRLDVGAAHVLVHRQGEDPVGLPFGRGEVTLAVAEAALSRWSRQHG